MEIPELLKATILHYAKTQEPREMCGFVIFDYQNNDLFFMPCENVASNPINYFEIGVDDFVRAEMQGEIIAVVHSHPDSPTQKGMPTLSEMDKAIQQPTALDWWLVCGGEILIFPWEDNL